MKNNSQFGFSVFLIFRVCALFVLSLILVGNIIGLAQYGSVPDVNNPDFGTALSDFPNESTETVIENVSALPGEVVSAVSPVAGISKLDSRSKMQSLTPILLFLYHQLKKFPVHSHQVSL